MRLVGVGDFRGIDNGDTAFTHDLQPTIAFKYGTGIFINANTEAIGMSRNRANQSSHAIAVVKVLVNNYFWDKSIAR